MKYIKKLKLAAVHQLCDVEDWLLANFNICIVSFPSEENWTFDIFNKTDCVKSESFFNASTEAYEAAIEYVLLNLI